ncbi:MAG: helix-turn-helix transcriptional regulator [Clostridia bacterium]|nr:helix-turn-helix transcriptional regulator [Clostridia bacterium]
MKCKVIPSAVGIKRPSIQVWKAATYRINRIHIPIKGKMLYHDINGVRLLDEGSIYFMINSCSQNFEMIPEYGYYHFYMDFQTLPPLLSREVLEIEFSRDPYLYYLIKAIESLVQGVSLEKREGNAREDILRRDPEMSEVQPILTQIVRHVQLKYNVRTVENPKLDAAIRYVEEHYAEKLHNEDIARVLHIDTRYLIRLFSKHLDMSPYLYLTQCRIEHALAFLREGKSVAETAVLCGYQSENAFRIAFKKMMGASPTHVMKQV